MRANSTHPFLLIAVMVLAFGCTPKDRRNQMTWVKPGNGYVLKDPALAAKLKNLPTEIVDSLHIIFESEFDNSIYLVREYSDLQGATCLQGIDANQTAPYREELSYTNTNSTPETIFIVIDHFDAICAFYPEIQFSLTIEP